MCALLAGLHLEGLSGSASICPTYRSSQVSGSTESNFLPQKGHITVGFEVPAALENLGSRWPWHMVGAGECVLLE